MSVRSYLVLCAKIFWFNEFRKYFTFIKLTCVRLTLALPGASFGMYSKSCGSRYLYLSTKIKKKYDLDNLDYSSKKVSSIEKKTWNFKDSIINTF